MGNQPLRISHATSSGIIEVCTANLGRIHHLGTYGGERQYHEIPQEATYS